MPRISKDTAPARVRWEGVEIGQADLDGGYAVCFETHTADADLALCSAAYPVIVPSCPAGAT